MPLYDAQCGDCEALYEAFAGRGSEVNFKCQCCPRGVVRVVWLKAPGVVQDSVGRYDIQLGRYISTRTERDRLLKERGLVALGPDEFRRTSSQRHDEPDGWDHDAFTNAAEKAANDLHYGNIPKVEPRTIDASQVAGVDGRSATPANAVE